jgi:threonine-phosphate decarboxylase
MRYFKMEKYNHGGIKTVSYDFSINLNPLGIMESVKDVLINSASKEDFYMNYPPAYPSDVESALAQRNNIDGDKISIGIGASELIDRLIRIIKPQRGLLLSPCFSEYERCLLNQGSQVIYHSLSEYNDFVVGDSILSSIDKLDAGDIFFICTPNNPNGLLVPLNILLECIKRCDERKIYLVIDISFLDFTKSYGINILENGMSSDTKTSYDKKLNRLIVNSKYIFLLNTLTKLFSIPSLRIGYGFSNNKELINNLNKYYIPWSVSTLAQKVALTIVEDKSYSSWIENTKETVTELREGLIESLLKLPITLFKSDANFILFKDENNTNLRDDLLKSDISIRDCSNYRELGNTYYRIAIKSKKENEYLIEVLSKLYGVNCG